MTESTPVREGNKPPVGRLFKAVKEQWFLVSILLLIPLGITLGPMLLLTPVINSGLAFFNSQVMTFCVLFLMSFTLDASRFRQAFVTPVPIILALCISYLLLPLLSRYSNYLPLNQELKWGLLIICCVPTTMATASVYTRQAGGNDAVSLVTTLVSNLLCPFVTPLLLLQLSGKTWSLNQQDLIYSLLTTAVLPIIIGQAFRHPRTLLNIADKYKVSWSFLAQCGILYMIFRTTVSQAIFLRDQVNFKLVHLLLITWFCCLLIHVCGLLAGHLVSRICSCTRENTIAVVFSGSQKTLPVGVYIASTISLNAGLLVLPIIIFHVTQLVVDTWVIGLYRMKKNPSSNNR